MPATRIAIVGAAGFLGEEITALGSLDTTLVCQPMTRQPCKFAGVESVAIEDLADDGGIDRLTDALAAFGADIVINCAGSSNWSDFNSVRQAAAIARTCLAAAAGRRFIQISSTSVTRKKLGGLASEVYVKSKREAEEVVRRASHRWPLRTTIIRVGQLGPSSIRAGTWSSHKSVLRKQILFKNSRIYAMMSNQIDIIPVDQVARFILRAALAESFPLIYTIRTTGLSRDELKAAAITLGINLEFKTPFEVTPNEEVPSEGIQSEIPPVAGYPIHLLGRMLAESSKAEM